MRSAVYIRAHIQILHPTWASPYINWNTRTDTQLGQLRSVIHADQCGVGKAFDLLIAVKLCKYDLNFDRNGLKFAGFAFRCLFPFLILFALRSDVDDLQTLSTFTHLN